MAGGWRGFALRRRPAWRVLAAACVLLPWPALTLGQAHGHDPGRGPPSDTGPPATAPAPEESPPRTNRPVAHVHSRAGESATGEPPIPSDHWHHNLIRERPLEVRLRTARRELDAGRLTEALHHVQAVLDCEDDVFVRLDSQPVPAGAQRQADELLGRLSADARQHYETLHGGEAQRLLAAARAAGDPQLLAGVMRRFFHTAAGAEAAIRLAHHWHDHGNEILAAACWQRLLASPAHRDRLPALCRVAAAEAFLRAGRPDLSQVATAGLGRSELPIGGSARRVDEWLAVQAHAAPSAAFSDAAMVCGAPDRNAGSAGSAPSLERPAWSLPLTGESCRNLSLLTAAWEKYQLQSGLPIGAAHFPLAVGGRLVFRDFEGIRAVSLETGETLWFYRAATALCREIASRGTIPAEGNPDPNNALQALIGNCVLGMLAGDCQRVYAVDRIETDPPLQTASAASATEAPSVPRRQNSALVALALQPGPPDATGSVAPLWRVGGRPPTAEDDSPPAPLAGHFFIGPPLPLGDRVFAVSELGQQLFLSCLDGASGRLSWTLPICSVPQPFSSDFHRKELVCTPSYADGVLVCPTQAGVLIAADPLTGRLLWAASHDDAEPQQRQQMSAWPYSARRRHSHRGYTNLPLIHEGRVVYLPAHSEFVHCLELSTGRVAWKVRREDLEGASAVEYVAAVREGTVLLVGRRRCRGLDLATGTERYTVRLGSTPAGRGVRLGDNYHVPLDDGRIVGFDVGSGRRAGSTGGSAALRLGNLIAAGDLVISMARDEITAWPQAAAALARLEAARSAGGLGAADALTAARLELALGRGDAAQARLDALARTNRSPALREQIAGLAREVLRARREDPLADRRELLGRLERLATTPADRARYLLERAHCESADGDLAALAATCRALQHLAYGELLPQTHDPSRTALAEQVAAGLFRQTAGSTPPEWFAHEADRALESGDAPAIRRLADLANGGPLADAARLRIAREWLRTGQAQAAELALLECRTSERPAIVAAATRLLAELWQARQLHHDAGRMLADLSARHVAVAVDEGVVGAEYLERFPKDAPAWEAYRRLGAPVWSGSGVRIIERPATHERLHALYNGNGVTPLPALRGAAFDLFDKGRGVAGQIVLVDRHTGAELAETISLPGRYSYPVSSGGPAPVQQAAGNLVPVGGTAAVYGVSLLERRVVWTTSVPGLAASGDQLIRIGPTGPGHIICQHKQHLLALDPADGRILWRRDDLETQSGLSPQNNDPQGIIGDARVVAVFSGHSAGGTHYTLYDTATGAELRRGRLDVQPRLPRRAYGRRLFHFTAGESRRMRVWDALTDEFVWDQPADDLAEASHLEGAAPGTKVFAFLRDGEEAAYVTRSGAIRVVDLPRGRTTLETPLDPALLATLGGLRAFADRDRYYFNLLHGAPPAKPPLPTYMISDTTLPVVHVHGVLCAVDRATRAVLWTHCFGQRSVLYLPDYRLPVVVTLFRVRPGDQPTLAAEVFDARSGASLGARSDLASDRLLQVRYERQPGLIALRGARTEIRLEFPADLALK